MDKDCLIVIPARYGSQRFPGKVLAKLGGKPVLQWCWEAAVRSGLGEVVVATEHGKVLAFARSLGARAVMTSPRCQSGTDRVYEASRGTKARFVINVQGDEPFMTASAIRKALGKLKASPDCRIGTACSRISSEDDLSNPNCVKVAMNGEGRALYFSRCPIPFHHPLSSLKNYPYYKHCGFYIYRRAALGDFGGNDRHALACFGRACDGRPGRVLGRLVEQFRIDSGLEQLPLPFAGDGLDRVVGILVGSGRRLFRLGLGRGNMPGRRLAGTESGEMA